MHSKQPSTSGGPVVLGLHPLPSVDVNLSVTWGTRTSLMLGTDTWTMKGWQCVGHEVIVFDGIKQNQLKIHTLTKAVIMGNTFLHNLIL